MAHGVALLLGVWLASAQTVVWLGPREPANLDTQALLAAVAVYTRDLQVVVRPAAEPATANSAVEGRAALAREADARLGFWCEVQPTQKVVTLTIVDDKGRLEIHLVEIKSADQAELHRAIALKIRAAVATSIAETAPAPPAAPSPAADAPATVAAVPALTVSPDRPAAPSERRFFLALDYRFSAPTGTAPLRHAAAAEGVVRAGRRIEIGLGTGIALPGEERASAGSVSLFDLPIRAAVRWLWPRPRLTFAAGPFLGAHLLWASADAADGATAASFSAAAGAGAEALVRVRLSNLLGGELRAFAETPIPTTRYWVREVPTLELGPRVGLAVGLVFPGP